MVNMFGNTNALSAANKLLVRCAWADTSAFASAGYGSSWGPGTCPAPHYTLMNDALSWSDANAACLAAGLQLASVHSAAQNALLLTAAAGNAVWIGGTDAASEHTWVWSPSNTPLSYTNWYSGEPNNAYSGGEDCLEFNYRGSDIAASGKWNDWGCSGKRKYVCQNAN